MSGDEIGERQKTLINLFGNLTKSSRPGVSVISKKDSILFFIGTITSGKSPRNARERTVISGLFLNYFEVWKEASNSGKYNLSKAYLHLDVPSQDGSAENEILALHCDPDIPSDDPSFQYKRGPHFHFHTSQYSLHKAHIAVCLQNLEKTCSDLSTLNSSYEKILKMIENEIFPYLDTT